MHDIAGLLDANARREGEMNGWVECRWATDVILTMTRSKGEMSGVVL